MFYPEVETYRIKSTDLKCKKLIYPCSPEHLGTRFVLQQRKIPCLP